MPFVKGTFLDFLNHVWNLYNCQAQGALTFIPINGGEASISWQAVVQTIFGAGVYNTWFQSCGISFQLDVLQLTHPPPAQ